MLHFLFYPLIFILLVAIFRYALMWGQLLRASFRYPFYRTQPSTSVPQHIQELFAPEIAKLSTWGFEVCGYYLVERMDDCINDRIWELLLQHPQFNTYARVGIRRPVEAVERFEVDFYTKFRNDTWLMTINGRIHNFLTPIPKTVIQDAYAVQGDEPWKLHCQKLVKLTTTETIDPIEPVDFIQDLEQQQRDYLDRLRRKKYIFPHRDGLWHISGWVAIAFLLKFDVGLWRMNRMLKQRRRATKYVSSIPIELELDSFFWMERHQQKNLHPKIKSWLLLGSFLIFIASYIQLINPLDLGILLLVLLLHEGGHLVAMKMCGYRQHYLLFLPFLGAVAAARKDDATMVDKTIVALAGPLPGLILGIILAISTQPNTNPPWLNTTIGILISLNVFNLLPIYPLDGGQVADVLVFSRHPYSDLLFKVVGASLFIIVGLSNAIALIFALLIAISIPGSFRTAKLHRQLRREISLPHPIDRAELLAEIFSLINRMGDGQQPFSYRYVLAQKLLQRHHESKTNWLTRVSLGAVYSISLIGGLSGSLIALVPELSFPWQHDSQITTKQASKLTISDQSDFKR